jgi:Fe-S cluster assembly protein SufD
MSAETVPDIDQFQSLLAQRFLASPKQDLLGQLKLKAWERFEELGLPARTHEVFRYLKMRQFYTLRPEFAVTVPSACDITPHLLPECTGGCLVFLNGVFTPSLSNLPEKIVVSTISQAANTYGALISNGWKKSIQEEQDPFALINLALQQDGAFVYIPPKFQGKAPIQILHYVTGDNPGLIPRLQVFAGAHSESTFSVSYAFESCKNVWMNQVADIAVEDNARVQFLQHSTPFPDDFWMFDALRATLKRDSRIHTVYFTKGCQSVRHDYRVNLTGENGDADLNGLWILDGKREAHTHVLINHQAPNCRSNQLFKGVLNGSSQSSFEGKIFVHREAQKTEAFQRNNNLILSDGAIANSKPNLEIFADDVKASHGATVGQLDQDQVFYMKTRGLDEAAANALLIQGFCAEVLELM